MHFRHDPVHQIGSLQDAPVGKQQETVRFLVEVHSPAGMFLVFIIGDGAGPHQSLPTLHVRSLVSLAFAVALGFCDRRCI
jgi:hypothetical protein